MSDERQRSRIDSIDLLRGIAMLLMLLDHTRQLYGPTPYAVLDLSQTSPQLFLTRWTTHLAAPVFIFLAGVSVYLYEQKAGSRARASKFLLPRGLWLILLQVTVVNLSWQGGSLLGGDPKDVDRWKNCCEL
ncbi:MAG: DUF1624 domain-containing protein [Gemmatimonadota bacterium]|nr:MAG: DUF1624 domain-containing protein [Gemmatimonadota bacterium]